MTLYSSIVAGNSAPDGPDIYGGYTNNGFSIVGGDPGLGVLADNGGPTFTHAVLPGSPAVDAGSCVATAITVDQRGETRPFDIPGVVDADDGCDIGAFETQTSCLPITVMNTDDSGSGSLRQAITDICDSGTILFDASLDGSTIPSANLAIGRNLTIDAQGQDITVGCTDCQVFHVTAGDVQFLDLSVDGSGPGSAIGIQVEAGASLTMENGEASGGGGGGGAAIQSSGALTINNVHLEGNAALKSLGAGASVAMEVCTLVTGSSGLVNEGTASMSGSTVTGDAGVFNSGDLEMENCEVVADANGIQTGSTLVALHSTFESLSAAGIHNTGYTRLTNSTVSGATAGIDNDQDLRVNNSTVVASSGPGIDNSGIDSLYSALIVGTPAVNGGYVDLDYNGLHTSSGDAGLDANGLADHGGHTRTIALFPSSPELDQGDCSVTALTTDQRGQSRPFNVPSVVDAGDGCDPGSYEAVCLPLATVTNNSDSGAGSFRRALSEVCPDGTIEFAEAVGGQTIDLTTGSLVLDRGSTITGPPGGHVYIDGGSPTLQHTQGTVTIADLSVNGGGLENSAPLTMTRSMLQGDITNSDELDLVNSTVTNGHVTNSGTLDITNSTISGNTCGSPGCDGGGIHNTGTTTIQNSTISDNEAPGGSGGGIYSTGSLTLYSSIVSGNSADSNQDISGAFTDSGYNLISGSAGLGALQPNGGPTPTHALLPGSPAVDQGACSVSGISEDQRGVTRPIDDPFGVVPNAADGCDIGAYEAETCANPEITVTNTNDSGAGSLRQAIAEVCVGGTIDFDSGLSGSTITLTSGELEISKSLTIEGLGSSMLAISGNDATRVFNISTGIVRLEDLKITHGYSGYGAGIYKHGNGTEVTIMGCRISENVSTQDEGDGDGSGIGTDDEGVLEIHDSEIVSNGNDDGGPHPSSAGGGIYHKDGTLVLHNVNVSGNQVYNYGGGLAIARGEAYIYDSSIGEHSNLIGGSMCISNGGTLEIHRSNISNCEAGESGGGIGSNGTLLISHSNVTNNSAANGFGGGGGGLWVQGGSAEVRFSTFSGNYSEYDGGAIMNQGTLTVVSSTISNNDAGYEPIPEFSGKGAGIYNQGTLEIQHSTIVGNEGVEAGGVYGPMTLYNTIIAGNTAPESPAGSPDLYGTITSNGYNLIGAGDGTIGWMGTDQVGSSGSPVDPLLAPLADNGGYTQTHLPLTGSPVIDAGDVSMTGLTTDQRDYVRPYDQPSVPEVADGTDIGSVEVQAEPGNVDYGDLPSPDYPTMFDDDGARHLIVDNCRLGDLVDMEADGQPHIHAEGDDGEDDNDEDGIVFVGTPYLPGGTEHLSITTELSGCPDAVLHCWADFNENDSFEDAGDHMVDAYDISPGTQLVPFLVPGDFVPIDLFVRCRLSSDVAAGSVTGLATDGEVEDYMVPWAILPLEVVSFEANATGREVTLTWQTIGAGNVARFAIEQMTGEGSYSEVAFVDVLSTDERSTLYAHTLHDLDFGSHRFRLVQVELDGTRTSGGEVEVVIELTEALLLESVYPNPFNPTATVRFAVGSEVPVSIDIYSLDGRLVRHIYQNTPKPNTTITVRLDATDLSSGVYLLRLMGNGKVLHRMVTLVK